MNRPITIWLIAILGAVVGGGVLGVFLAFCFASAEMLGAAEIYPPNQLPTPPVVEEWMALGGLAGAGLGLVVGVIACILFQLYRKFCRCEPVNAPED